MVKVHFKNCLDRYIHILSGNFIFIFCQPFPNGAIFYICIYILHLPFWTKGTWLFIFRPLFSHDFKITHLPSWFYTLKQKLELKTSSLLISLHVERTPGRRWKLCLSKGRRTTETRTWMSTGDEARKLKRKSEMKITEAKQSFRRKHQDWQLSRTESPIQPAKQLITGRNKVFQNTSSTSLEYDLMQHWSHWYKKLWVPLHCFFLKLCAEQQ